MPRLVDRDLQVEWRLSTDLFHRSYHTPGERLAAEAHRRIDALALGTRTATLISGSAERSLNIAYRHPVNVQRRTRVRDCAAHWHPNDLAQAAPVAAKDQDRPPS